MQVLELNQKLSDLLFYPSYILRYNSSSRQWKFYPYDLSNSPMFHFTWSFFTLCLWPLALAYVVLYRGIFSLVHIIHYFFAIIVIAPMILCNGLNIAFIISGAELIQYSNLIYKLGNIFIPGLRQSKTQPTIWMSLKHEFSKIISRSSHHNVDYIGLLMTLVVIGLSFAPLFYFIGVCLYGVDQFTYIARLHFKVPIDTYYYLLCLQHPQWFIFPVLTLSVAMEVFRALRTVFLAMAIPTEITLKLAKIVEEISKTDIDKAVALYRFIYSVHVKSMKSSGLLIFVATEGGILASILSITGTLIDWNISFDGCNYFKHNNIYDALCYKNGTNKLTINT